MKSMDSQDFKVTSVRCLSFPLQDLHDLRRTRLCDHHAKVELGGKKRFLKSTVTL